MRVVTSDLAFFDFTISSPLYFGFLEYSYHFLDFYDFRKPIVIHKIRWKISKLYIVVCAILLGFLWHMCVWIDFEGGVLNER